MEMTRCKFSICFSHTHSNLPLSVIWFPWQFTPTVSWFPYWITPFFELVSIAIYPFLWAGFHSNFPLPWCGFHSKLPILWISFYLKFLWKGHCICLRCKDYSGITKNISVEEAIIFSFFLIISKSWIFLWLRTFELFKFNNWKALLMINFRNY